MKNLNYKIKVSNIKRKLKNLKYKNNSKREINK